MNAQVNQKEFKYFKQQVVQHCTGYKKRLFVTDAKITEAFLKDVGVQYRALLEPFLNEAGNLAYLRSGPVPRICSIFSFLPLQGLSPEFRQAVKTAEAIVARSRIIKPLITYRSMIGRRVGLHVNVIPTRIDADDTVARSKRDYLALEKLLKHYPLDVIVEATKEARTKKNMGPYHFLTRLKQAAIKWEQYRSPVTIWYACVGVAPDYYDLNGRRSKSFLDSVRKRLHPELEDNVERTDAYIEWHDIEEQVKRVLDNLPLNKEFTGIVCISRGGLTPSHIIAEKLGIQRIKLLSVRSYQGKEQKELETLDTVPVIHDEGNNWLVIDDIVDSGKTMEYVKKLWPKAFCVGLVGKRRGKDAADYVAYTVADYEWVHFPWEK